MGVVESGLVSVLHGNTVVSVLEAGDLVYPDTDHLPAGVSTLLYGSEGGAFIRGYDRQGAHGRHGRQRAICWLDGRGSWVNMCPYYCALTRCISARQWGWGVALKSIRQGQLLFSRAIPQTTFSRWQRVMAEVLVNDMAVAKIRPGELFGTMAALTGSHRNATVRAMESCSVIRVPKDRFFELIRSRPAAVQGLLVDMAKSISELNEEVVALKA